jgi:hypothetical protein
MRSTSIPLYPSSCANVALKPSIQRILKIFDPTTAQIAISVFFFKAAMILEASSGRLVPTAIIVSPINASLMPRVFAIITALLTISCHP